MVEGDRLAGELPRSPPGRRRQHGPEYLLSPMPRSHTTNEYTDPQARANHRTQRTAEIRYNPLLCLGWGGMIDSSLQAPKEGSTQDQLRRHGNIVCELRRARL